MLWSRSIICSMRSSSNRLPCSSACWMALLQIFEGVLVPLAERHVLCVEAALQQEIGERLQQIFGVDAEIFAGVAGVANRISS